MKIKLTKKFILDAIADETIPLRPGQWAGTTLENIVQGSCVRCAVGAVLMRAMKYDAMPRGDFSRIACIATGDGAEDIQPDSNDHDYLTDIEADALDILERGQPMAALSFFFEGAGHHVDNYDDLRRETLVFIQDHFPEEVVVDINGAEPAQDVEVV